MGSSRGVVALGVSIRASRVWWFASCFPSLAVGTCSLDGEGLPAFFALTCMLVGTTNGKYCNLAQVGERSRQQHTLATIVCSASKPRRQHRVLLLQARNSEVDQPRSRVFGSLRQTWLPPKNQIVWVHPQSRGRVAYTIMRWGRHTQQSRCQVVCWPPVGLTRCLYDHSTAAPGFYPNRRQQHGMVVNRGPPS